ncbi:MAG: HAD family hydrolase [Bacteroidetes bacterium]|nr:HAD family hydrolase [Bacteroidota bacterium]
MTDRFFLYLDLDNTLIDHSRAERQAFRETLMTVMGSDAQFDLILADYHRVNTQLWKDYAAYRITQDEVRHRRFSETLARFGLSHLESDFTRHYYLRYQQNWHEVPGAARLLDSLRPVTGRVGLLSNGFADIQREKLKTLGWEDRFDPVIYSEEAGFHKPDRRLFRIAEQACGFPPERIIYVGDSVESDVNGASEAGWLPVFFDYSGAGIKPEKAIASIGALDGLPDVLARLV